MAEEFSGIIEGVLLEIGRSPGCLGGEGRYGRARACSVRPMAATDDAPQQFANAQYEIYLQGIGDVLPEFPMTYDGLEAKARELLSQGAYGYVAGGAGDESTMRANRAAFDRWRIVPR